MPSSTPRRAKPAEIVASTPATAAQRGAKRKPKKLVAVRLDEETMDRIEALVPSLSTDWRKAKRADALRKLILSGLAAEEARQRSTAPPAPPPGPRKARKPKG